MRYVLWVVGVVVAVALLVNLFSPNKGRELGEIINVEEIQNKKFLRVQFKDEDVYIKNDNNESFILPYNANYYAVKNSVTGKSYLVWEGKSEILSKP